MRLVLHARGEVERVGVAPRAAIARYQRPQVADRDRLSVATQQSPEESVVARIERIDRAIAEIADQQIAGELAEALAAG